MQDDKSNWPGAQSAMTDAEIIIVLKRVEDQMKDLALTSGGPARLLRWRDEVGAVLRAIEERDADVVDTKARGRGEANNA